MNLPVTYIFTHDSIDIGKDGPTHEPVEQLTMLRDIPNLCVYRPVDLKEIIGSYQSILSHNNPVSLCLIEFLNEPILLAIVGTLTKDASTHLFSLFA